MKTATSKIYLPALIIIILFGFGCIESIDAQPGNNNASISPIYGKIMMVGGGDIPMRAKATFGYLAGEEQGNLVIVCNNSKAGKKGSQEWKKLVGTVSMVVVDESNANVEDSDLELIKNASAVWLIDDLSKQFSNTPLQDELIALLRRDGVIGGQGKAAESMSALVKDNNRIHDGFGFIPNSFIHTGKDNQDDFNATLNNLPGRVGWYIPSGSSVVIYDNRKISVITFPGITLRTAANGLWEEKAETIEPPIDDLPYTTDLIAWNRSGLSRLGELFPPATAPSPVVPKGALLIIGGHGYPDEMWEKVVDFAGGKNAKYVCLSQGERSWGAEHLRELGCENISVHMVKLGVDGISQGSDPKLLADLINADVVYFGGGRTYKYLDAYMGTPAHELMNKVLERGGIIVGTSAGAQIQGDYLVRGDPRTNHTLYLEGSDQGLGFLNGVIIDAHFRERGRHNITPELLVKYPQMLGIGIDETTALWVEGTTAEVMGPHSVTFYDLKNQKGLDPNEKNVGNPVILMEGEKYDLKERRKIED